MKQAKCRHGHFRTAATSVIVALGICVHTSFANFSGSASLDVRAYGEGGYGTNWSSGLVDAPRLVHAEGASAVGAAAAGGVQAGDWWGRTQVSASSAGVGSYGEAASELHLYLSQEPVVITSPMATSGAVGRAWFEATVTWDMRNSSDYPCQFSVWYVLDDGPIRGWLYGNGDALIPTNCTGRWSSEFVFNEPTTLTRNGFGIEFEIDTVAPTHGYSANSSAVELGLHVSVVGIEDVTSGGASVPTWQVSDTNGVPLTSASSRIPVVNELSIARDSGNLNLKWFADPNTNVVYQLKTCTNLPTAGWTNWGEAVHSTGWWMTNSTPWQELQSDAGFFRLTGTNALAPQGP